MVSVNANKKKKMADEWLKEFDANTSSIHIWQDLVIQTHDFNEFFLMIVWKRDRLLDFYSFMSSSLITD